MSMFHELMMRKKEETLYPVIKGSLTESPEGVFSGFSASGYLELQQNLDSDNLEMVIDFTTGNSLTTYETIFLNRSIFDLEYYNGYLASYNWQSPTYVQVIPSTDFTANTHYKVKIKRNGNTISFSYSKNGSAFIDTGSFTTTKTATNLPCFGNSSVNTSRYFTGSIDLNNSYIKLGSTKYKLQAVVGYTVVGSPTITDGVVSGVNPTNGIFTASSIPSFQTFEFVTKVGTVWNSTSSYLPVCAFNNSSSGYKHITAYNSNKKIVLNLANNDTDKGVVDNFPYATALTSSGVYIKLLAQKNTNDWTYTLAFSTDKLNWISGQLVSTVSIEGTPICFIKNLIGTSGGDTWIDMKETSIKINNKLWFNGQQS